MENPIGLVAKIEPFAVRSGPGLRTVVFMKGCPLQCPWCALPQMQKATPEILFHGNRCRSSCIECVRVCSKKALRIQGRDTLVLNRRQCDGCGLCAEACPRGALEKTGRFYSPKDLLDEIEKDLPFYKLSQGGVTISGGEPAGQTEFVAAFLRQCRKRQIHTAVETSGFAPWPALASWLESLDLLFFNLNHMDPGKHKELTGVSNQKILRNIQKAAGRVPVILRLLLVPGLNDQPDNLAGVVRFAQGLGQSLVRVELIPFYRQGEEVYRKLRKAYPLSSVQPLENEIIEKLKDTIESQGLKAQIGG